MKVHFRNHILDCLKYENISKRKVERSFSFSNLKSKMTLTFTNVFVIQTISNVATKMNFQPFFHCFRMSDNLIVVTKRKLFSIFKIIFQNTLSVFIDILSIDSTYTYLVNSKPMQCNYLAKFHFNTCFVINNMNHEFFIFHGNLFS